MRRPTLVDVARGALVSKPTVSLVRQGRTMVRAGARAGVRQAIPFASRRCRTGGRIATEHRIARVARDIAFVGGPEGRPIAAERMEGFLAVMDGHGLSPRVHPGRGPPAVRREAAPPRAARHAPRRGRPGARAVPVSTLTDADGVLNRKRPAMILHCVFCALRPDADPAEWTSVMEELAALRGEVDGMIEVRAGVNRDYEGKSPRHGQGFVIAFRDRAAHLAYDGHPRHRAAGARLVALCEGGADGIVVYDLETA